MNLKKCSNCYQEEELQKLQLFLMKECQGKLDQDKTPAENAIKIIKEANNELSETC